MRAETAHVHQQFHGVSGVKESREACGEPVDSDAVGHNRSITPRDGRKTRDRLGQFIDEGIDPNDTQALVGNLRRDDLHGSGVTRDDEDRRANGRRGDGVPEGSMRARGVDHEVVPTGSEEVAPLDDDGLEPLRERRSNGSGLGDVDRATGLAEFDVDQRTNRSVADDGRSAGGRLDMRERVECDGEWHSEDGNGSVEILGHRVDDPGGDVAVGGKASGSGLTEEAEIRAGVRILAAGVAVKTRNARVEHDRCTDRHTDSRTNGIDVAVHLMPKHGGQFADPLPGTEHAKIGVTDSGPADSDANLTGFRRGNSVRSNAQCQIARKPKRQAIAVADRGLVSQRNGLIHRHGAYLAVAVPTRLGDNPVVETTRRSDELASNAWPAPGDPRALEPLIEP